MMQKAILSVCLLISISVNAQIRIGTITGTVTDPAGARIAGAKLTLSNAIAGFEETRVARKRFEMTRLLRKRSAAYFQCVVVARVRLKIGQDK